MDKIIVKILIKLQRFAKLFAVEKKLDLFKKKDVKWIILDFNRYLKLLLLGISIILYFKKSSCYFGGYKKGY